MQGYQNVNLNTSPSRTGDTIKRELLTILSYDIAGFIIEFKTLELNNNGFDENEFYFIKQEILRYINELLTTMEESHRDYFLINMFASIIDNLDMILNYEHVQNYSLEELNDQETSSIIEDQLAGLVLEYLLPEINNIGGKRKTKKLKKKKNRKTRSKKVKK